MTDHQIRRDGRVWRVLEQTDPPVWRTLATLGTVHEARAFLEGVRASEQQAAA